MDSASRKKSKQRMEAMTKMMKGQKTESDKLLIPQVGQGPARRGPRAKQMHLQFHSSKTLCKYNLTSLLLLQNLFIVNFRLGLQVIKPVNTSPPDPNSSVPSSDLRKSTPPINDVELGGECAVLDFEHIIDFLVKIWRQWQWGLLAKTRQRMPLPAVKTHQRQQQVLLKILVVKTAWQRLLLVTQKRRRPRPLQAVVKMRLQMANFNPKTLRMRVSTATATGGSLADKPNAPEGLGPSLSFENTRPPPPPATPTNEANVSGAAPTSTATAPIKKSRKKRIFKDSVTAA
jgi:hypothetical protein